jgi:hypothetical protein
MWGANHVESHTWSTSRKTRIIQGLSRLSNSEPTTPKVLDPKIVDHTWFWYLVCYGETQTFSDFQAAAARLDALENDNAMAPDVIEVREDDEAFNIEDEMDEGGCPLLDRPSRLRFAVIAMNALDGRLGRGQCSRWTHAALRYRQLHSLTENPWASLLSIVPTRGWVYNHHIEPYHFIILLVQTFISTMSSSAQWMQSAEWIF